MTFSLCFLLVTCTPIEIAWTSLLESRWTQDIPPVLLILGGDQQAPGLLGFSSYIRLNYAVRFWRQGKVRFLVVSGGVQRDYGDSPPLAREMRDFLLGHGIPASAILTEEGSGTTLENFRMSRPVMEKLAGDTGFLTSDYHSGRALRVSERMGLHWRPVPVPDVRKRWTIWAQRWPLAFELSKETAKWVWYAVHGWI